PNGAAVDVGEPSLVCTYTSSNCAPIVLPNVGVSLFRVVRRYTTPSFVSTWKRVMSKEPAENADEFGYAYVPGPLSSPVGSLVSRTVTPPTRSPTTDVRATPVPELVVAATVMMFVPNPTGTETENAPPLSAVVLTVDVTPATS